MGNHKSYHTLLYKKSLLVDHSHNACVALITATLHSRVHYYVNKSCFYSGVSLSLNPLHQIDSPQGKLSFAWEPLIITECPSLRYNIVATEGCGVCPTSRSASENFITCTNVQRGKSCTFSVFVNLCSDVIRSDAITVSTGKDYMHMYSTT
jgi:hypothetical protein